MTVIKVDNGLMLINPLPPTKELINELEKLIAIHGKVKTIILPSASGLEHKIGLPALSRIFKDAEIWLCPQSSNRFFRNSIKKIKNTV